MTMWYAYKSRVTGRTEFFRSEELKVLNLLGHVQYTNIQNLEKDCDVSDTDCLQAILNAAPILSYYRMVWDLVGVETDTSKLGE